MLAELVSEERAAYGATDLSGDSGAIGRMIVDGQRMQLDLKGAGLAAFCMGTLYLLAWLDACCPPSGEKVLVWLSVSSTAVTVRFHDTPPTPTPTHPLLGVLYEATVVPSPTTLAIVNISGTEAKVECLLSEFIQLR